MLTLGVNDSKKNLESKILLLLIVYFNMMMFVLNSIEIYFKIDFDRVISLDGIS